MSKKPEISHATNVNTTLQYSPTLERAVLTFSYCTYSSEPSQLRLAITLEMPLSSEPREIQSCCQLDKKIAHCPNSAVQESVGGDFSKETLVEAFWNRHTSPRCRKHDLKRSIAQCERGYECISCHDETTIREGFCLGCGHTMCRHCIRRILDTASESIASKPAECCRRPLDLDNLCRFALFPLDGERLKHWRRKQEENESNDRTYCANPSCATYIPKSSILGNGLAACPSCEDKTCSACKNPVKCTHECLSEDENDELSEVAR